MVEIELLHNRIFHVRVTERSPWLHKPDGMTLEHVEITINDRWLTPKQMEEQLPDYWPLVGDIEFNHLTIGIELATIEIWAEWY